MPKYGRLPLSNISGSTQDPMNESESSTWNLADAYVKLKIFKPLFECDVYEMIAQYGVEDVRDIIEPFMLVSKRIEGLYRYKDTLKILMDNSLFIIKKEDKENFIKLKNHLLFIENIMDGVSRIEHNQVNHTDSLIINEEYFRKVLTSLQKIKSDIVSPLNSAGIVFRQNESMSFEELLDDIATGG
jgi:hypothetical protein